VIALAIDSGIPPSVWWAEGDDVLLTALGIVAEARRGGGEGTNRRRVDGG
jgi:hypothetical protein